MIKAVATLFLLTFSFVPAISSAQISDIDPNPEELSCVTLQNNLRYRSRDIYTKGEVSTLQDFLQSKGHLNSEPTGYFGLLTLQAAKDFQRANGIEPTGYVGPITRAKIKALTCDQSNIEDIVISPSPDLVQESVKCVFNGSNKEEKCYRINYNDNFGSPSCSGINACIADIQGYKGTRMSWQSSCSGSATTILDGNSEYANFYCYQVIDKPTPTPVPEGPIEQPSNISIITPERLPNATVGKSYLTAIEIVGYNGPSAEWSISENLLPPGIGYANPPIGSTCKNLCYYLGGVPTQAGDTYVFYFTFKANGQTYTKSFRLTVDPAPVSQSLQIKNITWVNSAGLDISGNSLSYNTLTKTAESVWGNAGATSYQGISSGDGYVEFSTNESNLYKVAGLSSDYGGQGYMEIDYGLHLGFQSDVYILENGTNVAGKINTYLAGDVFRVSVESGQVKYYKNGALFHTSGQAPTYPLFLDTSIYSTGATIVNSKIAF